MAPLVTDATAVRRIRELAAEGGAARVGDMIWYEREPWTKSITRTWPAVDTFDVSLALDTDRTPPGAEPPHERAPTRSATAGSRTHHGAARRSGAPRPPP